MSKSNVSLALSLSLTINRVLNTFSETLTLMRNRIPFTGCTSGLGFLAGRATLTNLKLSSALDNLPLAVVDLFLKLLPDKLVVVLLV